MSDDESSTPSLSEAIRRRIEKALSRLRVGLPATIIEYDAASRRATVQAMIWHADTDERGERVAREIKQIRDVPVIGLGSGKARIKFPVHPGDGCFLVFSSSDITRWKTSGKSGDPGSDRRHHINDAVAVLGLEAFPDVEDDPILIEFTDAGLIEIGGAGADSTIRATPYLSAESTMLGVVSAALAAIAVPGALVAGTQATAAQTAIGLAVTAISTFTGGQASYITTVVKLR